MESPISCYDRMPGFSWGVIRAFADALVVCRFEEGDVVHGPEHSIQVVAPRRGTAARIDEEQDCAFTDNWNTPVEISMWSKSNGENRLIKTTQGRLYCLFWKGDLKTLEVGTPLPPLLARSLMARLPETVDNVSKVLPRELRHGWLFLSPFCMATKRLWTKARAIENVFGSFGGKTGSVRLEDTGLADYELFAPTVEVAWAACSRRVSRDNLERGLKDVLHKPNKQKKTDRDGFQLKRHGFLVEPTEEQ